MSDPYAYRSFEPISERLKVTEGTNQRSRRCVKKPGITAGMGSEQNLRYQKVKKVLRKGQKEELSVGFEPGSEAEDAWIEELEQPGIFGLDGQEKHFFDLLQNDSEESNFF